MKLTILGCSGSVPAPDSPCSGYLVESGGTRLLLDLGNGALGALQRHLDPFLLDAVAIRRRLRDDVDAAPVVPRLDRSARRRWIATGFLAASIVFGAGAAWLLPPLLREQRADVPPTPSRVVTFDTAAAAEPDTQR